MSQEISHNVTDAESANVLFDTIFDSKSVDKAVKNISQGLLGQSETSCVNISGHTYRLERGRVNSDLAGDLLGKLFPMLEKTKQERVIQQILQRVPKDGNIDDFCVVCEKHREILEQIEEIGLLRVKLEEMAGQELTDDPMRVFDTAVDSISDLGLESISKAFIEMSADAFFEHVQSAINGVNDGTLTDEQLDGLMNELVELGMREDGKGCEIYAEVMSELKQKCFQLFTEMGIAYDIDKLFSYETPARVDISTKAEQCAERSGRIRGAVRRNVLPAVMVAGAVLWYLQQRSAEGEPDESSK